MADVRAGAGVVIIGVGNALRGDDAAGLEVARRLRPRALAAGILVREQEGEALGLLEQWDGAAAALLVDAIRSAAPAGTVQRMDLSAQVLPARLRGSTSTHAVGMGEAIERARALGRLPAHVIVYGIEGRCFSTGSGLSGEVAAAIGPLSERVLGEARRLAG